MARQKTPITTTIIFLLLNLQIFAQQTDGLTRSTPEKEGVSSAGILNFLKAAGKSKHEFHSFMFLRHGKVIAEGWWNPYQSSLKHTMYSASKSFTATAIGFAVTEHKLNLDDKVVSFFPSDLPDTVSAYLSELTVKDVLSMSDGQDPDPTFATVSKDSNWVKGFLSTPVLNEPGTKFLYNSLGTYMLSAIVQKVTGQKVIDYLRPRLFKPLGIEGMDWEVDPHGINTGGWGLRIKTADMAKFGQLFLQKGKWKGNQLIPEAWINEATTLKIEQDPNAPAAKKDSNDWLQGYCYQMWRCRNNAYRADGAFGQYIIVMPEQDAVVAITAETPDMQGEIDLVWQYLLPAMQKKSLSADNNNMLALKQTSAKLTLPFPGNGPAPAKEKEISKKTFGIESNEKQVNSIGFRFSDGILHLTIKKDTAVYLLSFGSAKWARGETTKEGPYLVAGAKARGVGLPASKIMGGYRWKDRQTLELTLRYIESPHTETMICHFEQNNISVEIHNSFNPSVKTVLNGTSR